MVSESLTEHGKRRYHASLKIRRIGKTQTNPPYVNGIIAKNHELEAQMAIILYLGKSIIITELIILKCEFNKGI